MSAIWWVLLGVCLGIGSCLGAQWMHRDEWEEER